MTDVLNAETIKQIVTSSSQAAAKAAVREFVSDHNNLMPPAAKVEIPQSIWRSWSLRLNALGAAILLWVSIDPVSVLYVWQMMPPEVRGLIPTQIVSILGGLIFGLSMLARIVRQPKLQEKINAPDK